MIFSFFLHKIRGAQAPQAPPRDLLGEVRKLNFFGSINHLIVVQNVSHENEFHFVLLDNKRAGEIHFHMNAFAFSNLTI